MSRVGAAARLILYGLAFLLLLAPQLLSLRFGRGRLAGLLPVLLHRFFLRLFHVHVSVVGKPRPGGTLVVANHVSWLDIFVLGSLLPLSFVAKSEVAGWPFIGFLARLQRTVFIERARRSHTAEVNGIVAGRLAAGDEIVLFAEGTTGDGNRVLPFRASLIGAARAALALGDLDRVHLQPLAIAYTRRNGMPVTRRERPEIAWYGDVELVPHVSGFLREGPVDATVIWGDPIAFDATSDRKRAAVEIEEAIRTAIRTVLRGRAS
jgi:1-acyl-sn-glycerol-3-phosphate acyltransferase